MFSAGGIGETSFLSVYHCTCSCNFTNFRVCSTVGRQTRRRSDVLHHSHVTSTGEGLMGEDVTISTLHVPVDIRDRRIATSIVRGCISVTTSSNMPRIVTQIRRRASFGTLGSGVTTTMGRTRGSRVRVLFRAMNCLTGARGIVRLVGYFSSTTVNIT